MLPSLSEPKDILLPSINVIPPPSPSILPNEPVEAAEPLTDVDVSVKLGIVLEPSFG